MGQWEQYEIWVLREETSRWELVAAFPDFDVAAAVARRYRRGIRLTLVTYEGNKAVDKQVIAELGQVRLEAS